MAAIPAAIFVQNAEAAKTPNRPNVIFILMDDAGYGDFGCYNQHKIETPNIDALGPDENPYDERTYSRFKGFINRNHDEEFFLMWTTTLPHTRFSILKSHFLKNNKNFL